MNIIGKSPWKSHQKYARLLEYFILMIMVLVHENFSVGAITPVLPTFPADRHQPGDQKYCWFLLWPKCDCPEGFLLAGQNEICRGKFRCSRSTFNMQADTMKAWKKYASLILAHAFRYCFEPTTRTFLNVFVINLIGPLIPCPYD